MIENLGNKVTARKIMAEAGIPMVPGTENLSPVTRGCGRPLAFAEKYGYPVMLKATAGGGGRGIRRIENEKELREQYPIARAEAKAAFNDDSVYLEKVVINPKHVEVQIIADKNGNTVHLGTRDCSIQRRNQKLVEIAPAFHDLATNWRKRSARPRSRRPRPPTTSMPAPSSSCWTGTTTTISWRSTPGSRWSIPSPR